MKSPSTAPWPLPLSDADFAKLKAGFQPSSMDDKWLIAAAAASETSSDSSITIHIKRNWTKTELYQLRVKNLSGGAAMIENLTWEQDKGGVVRVSEEQGKREVVFLCRSMLGCELEGGAGI